MVATAQAGGYRLLLTEDLQDGQEFEGLRVVNSFRHTVAEELGKPG